jgi:hypothetical protein
VTSSTARMVVGAGWIDARFPGSMALYCTLVGLMAVSHTCWRSVPRYDLALFPALTAAAEGGWIG